MDGAGVLYSAKDPAHVGALIDQVVSNAALRDQVVAGQDAALDRLLAKDFPGTLLGFIDRVVASPRQTKRAVMDDFWDQVASFEQFEELTQFRPALYCALPKAPSRIV
jgi:hypothetical protein